MFNHSLVTADRSTHIKIAAVAIVAALVLVAVGFRAKIGDAATVTAGIETTRMVVKAGAPVTSASTDASSIR